MTFPVASTSAVRSILIATSTIEKLYEPTWNRALNEIGVKCRIFDTRSLLSKRIMGKFEHHFLWGPGISKSNRELIRTVKHSRPDVTLLYQGRHYWPKTIRELRKYSFVVGYHNDDPLGSHKHQTRYRHIKRALPFYHGYHCFRDCSLKDLSEVRVKNAAVMMFYFTPWLDYPRTLSSKDHKLFDSDLTFAGHWEDDHRMDCLSAAVRKGIQVRLYGRSRGWKPAIPKDIRRILNFEPPIWGEDYRKALCGSRIAVCFLSKMNRDQYTTRVFEIPACGVFLLAERTPVMQQLYEEGKQAEFFSSPEEFLDKARFYLNHPEARKRIAEAGHHRAMTSGYDVHSRMRQWLQDVKRWKMQYESTTSGLAAA